MKKLMFVLCALVAFAASRPAAAVVLPPTVPPGCVLQWVTVYKWVEVSPGNWVPVPYTYPVCR